MKKIFIFSAFLALLFFFSSLSQKPSFAETCTTNGAQRCSGANFQQCNNGTWVNYTCSTGTCCKLVAPGNVSCLATACGSIPGGSCSPIGSERCVDLNTNQTCTATGWGNSSDCPSGHYCRVISSGSFGAQVSCIKGCAERQASGQPVSCKSSCATGETQQPTYYCSSGVCCVASTKFACVSGTCQPSTTGTFTEATCGGTCAPPSTYTCQLTPGQYCSPYGCSPDNSGTGNCDPTKGAPNCCAPKIEGCNVCRDKFAWNWLKRKCVGILNGFTVEENPVSVQTCTSTQLCSQGCGCDCGVPKGFTGSGSLPCGLDGKTCLTAFGKINTDPVSLVKAFFGIVLSISGGIAVLLIILAGYRLVASQGNPEKINEAKEHLTAAIIGLLFIIFSFSILRFIGVDVLGLFP